MRAHSLQRRGHGLGRSRWGRLGWFLLIVLLLAEIGSVFFLSRRGRVESYTSERSRQQIAPAQGDRSVVGYTFEEPRGWSSTENGMTTILTSPDQSIVISVGLIDGSDSGSVSDRVLALLDEQYHRLTVTDESVDGSNLTVHGRALNSARVRLRFTSITVAAAGSCHQQIIAFSDIGVEMARVETVVDDLLGTLELSGDGCDEKLSA
jgi:hypothetical protein